MLTPASPPHPPTPWQLNRLYLLALQAASCPHSSPAVRMPRQWYR